MVLIGFVLLAAAAAFGVDVAAQNRFNLDIDVFGQAYTASPAVVLVGGVVIGLVAALGLMLMRDGARRRLVLRRDAKDAAAERDRLSAAAEEHEAERKFDVGAIDSKPLDLRDRDRVTTF
jgi:hypothetical protein